MNDDQLNLAIETARAAATRGDFAAAVETQARVVAQLRLAGQAVSDWVSLSVQLFNLADYYAGMEQFAEAIRLLEEVVALDERLGLPDIDSDRQMLEQVRQLAAMTPGERKHFYQRNPASQPTLTTGPDEVTQLLEQLEGVESIDRAEIEVLMRQLVGLSPEEQVKRVLEMRAKDRGDELSAE